MAVKKDKNNQNRGFYHRTVANKRKMSELLKGRKLSESTKKKIGDKAKGRPVSKETREKLRLRGLNRKHTLAERIKMSVSMKKNAHKYPNWKGGITDQQYKIRASLEYKLWREAVFKRDAYTCVWCGLKFIKGITGTVVLQADHIKAFADYPELRFAIDNGRTLCVECHKKTFDYGWKHRFHKED